MERERGHHATICPFFAPAHSRVIIYSVFLWIHPVAFCVIMKLNRENRKNFTTAALLFHKGNIKKLEESKETHFTVCWKCLPKYCAVSFDLNPAKCVH